MESPARFHWALQNLNLGDSSLRLSLVECVTSYFMYLKGAQHPMKRPWEGGWCKRCCRERTFPSSGREGGRY